MKSRLYYIDITKAIGISIVILSHTEYTQPINYLGFFVPLFYFLTGYTFHERNIGYAQVVKNKYKRLLIPYFFLCFSLYLLYSLIYGFKINGFLGVFYSRYELYHPGYPDNILFLYAWNGPLWFLTSMFCTFMVFYCVRNLKGWRLLIFSFICIIVPKVLGRLPVLLPWSLDTVLYTTLLMLFGKLSCEKRAEKWRFQFYLIILIVYGISQYLNGTANLSIGYFGRNIILYFILSITGILLMIKLGMQLEKFSILRKLLVPIGQQSLLIFCIQMPLLELTGKIAKIVLNDIMIIAICQVLSTLFLGYYIAVFLTRLLPFFKK